MAIFFTRVDEYELVKAGFYGLRPMVTSLIAFATIKFAMSNHVLSLNVDYEMISLLAICAASLYFLSRWKAHPLFVIVGAGIIGSYDRLVKGIQYLKEAKVEFNILTVLHDTNINKVRD